jgi:hypothetical protein
MWMSIEVIDGAFAANRWADAHGDALIESALRHEATDWNWHRHPWGVVFELEFSDEAAWERYRNSASVQAALDAVPDPVLGLVIYKGRGGSSGTRQPRKPRPFIGSGAVELPLPDLVEELSLTIHRLRPFGEPLPVPATLTGRRL